MLSNVPLKYLLFANFPICVAGLVVTICKTPRPFALPIIAFQIAFGILVLARAVMERKVSRPQG